ncbi:MAG: InlB B-repeat-containing protein [Coriobacteriales bacterium]|jgi:uncharacterized repeat protein (TIGR02543 family)|nr:InlB B-repeat-containing protein [Coriobacteriales bacterium]
MKQAATPQTTPTKGASALLRLLLAVVLALGGLVGAAPAFADEPVGEGGAAQAAVQGDGEEGGDATGTPDGAGTSNGDGADEPVTEPEDEPVAGEESEPAAGPDAPVAPKPDAAPTAELPALPAAQADVAEEGAETLLPAAAQDDGEEGGEAQADGDAGAAGEGAEVAPLAAGNSLGSAVPCALGTTVNGAISAPKSDPEADFYSFTLASSGRLSLEFDTESLENAALRVYDIDGTILWNNGGYILFGTSFIGSLGWNDTAKKAHLSISLWLNSGTYRFGVIKVDNYTGAYSFRLSATSSNESFKEGHLGSDNTFSAANPIALGATYRGQVSYAADPADFYSFLLASSGKLSVEFDTQSLAWANLLVYDIDGTVVWENSRYTGDLGWNDTAKKASYRSSVWLHGGSYRFCVKKYSDYTGAYSFRLSATSSNESFKEGYLGSNNTFAAASPIALGRTYRGQLSYAADPADFYSFAFASSGVLTVALDTRTLTNATLLLYNSKGDVVWEDRGLGWDDTAKRANYRASVPLKRGAYRFCVESNGSTGAYSFKLEKAKVHTVKLSANGGKLRKGAASSVRRSHGTELGKLATPSRAGHDFLGWYTAKAGGRKVATTTKVTKNVTLHAHWKAKVHTVRLDANGGKVKGWYSVATVKRAHGSKLGRLAVPKRPGYAFQGWYTAKHGGKRAGAATRVAKSVTLYAHWKRAW